MNPSAAQGITNLHQEQESLSFAIKPERNTVTVFDQKTTMIHLLSRGHPVPRASFRRTISGEPFDITLFKMSCDSQVEQTCLA
jgi:hypothetical protein